MVRYLEVLSVPPTHLPQRDYGKKALKAQDSGVEPKGCRGTHRGARRCLALPCGS